MFNGIYKIIEIIIIAICGLGAFFYLVWYFRLGARKNRCSGCAVFELKTKLKAMEDPNGPDKTKNCSKK
jgi:hypothetical protein